MKAFNAPGDLLTLTAPEYGVVSDGAYLIGSLVVIAAETAAEDAPFQGAAKGVFDLPKPDQEDWAEGDKIYFDEAAGLFTTEAGSPPNVLVGVAIRAVPLSLELASDADAGTSPPISVASPVITIADYSDLAGATVTVTVNGVATVLTEGVDFDAETSNAVTATNLAAAITALVVGATAAAGTASDDDDEVTVTVTNPSIIGRVRLDGVAR